MVPLSVAVLENMKAVVKAEPEPTIEPHPANGGAIGQAQVGGRPGAAGEFAFQVGPVAGASIEDEIGLISQQRGRIRPLNPGFQEGETRPRPESPGRLLRGESSLGQLWISKHLGKLPQSSFRVDVLLLEKCGGGCLATPSDVVLDPIVCSRPDYGNDSACAGNAVSYANGDPGRHPCDGGFTEPFASCGGSHADTRRHPGC